MVFPQTVMDPPPPLEEAQDTQQAAMARAAKAPRKGFVTPVRTAKAGLWLPART